MVVVFCGRNPYGELGVQNGHCQSMVDAGFLLRGSEPFARGKKKFQHDSIKQFRSLT